MYKDTFYYNGWIATIYQELAIRSLWRMCNGKEPQTFFPTQIPILCAKKTVKFFHANVYKPMNLTSFGKFRYFVLFKDDFFGYKFVFNVKNKYDVLLFQTTWVNCFKKILAAKYLSFVMTWVGNFWIVNSLNILIT